MDTPTFALADLDSIDEVEMEVIINGGPSGWFWKFAGPGHPLAEAQSNRIARETLAKTRLQEQQRLNGKKVKVPEQSPDDLLEGNIAFVLERLVDWSAIDLDGKPYPFSRDNARALLKDRRKGWMLQQAIDFVLDENSFMPRSAKN